MTTENVNHPQHYNSHPNGIECIEIIRHYTCDIANAIKYLWRAGLKLEMGKDDADKEIEDLKKALWYIEDYRSMCDNMRCHHRRPRSSADCLLFRLSGHHIEDVTKGYDEDVATAMDYLLRVGIVSGSTLYAEDDWAECLQIATCHIHLRILNISMMLACKDVKDTVDIRQGVAVEGEDYVAKPGGVRDTEPDNYDPLNIIIIGGTAYCLTSEKREKPNGSLYSPCDNCNLKECCAGYASEASENNLCNLHSATGQQYYREVGYCKYRPSFGTIEVVDEEKETKKELKKLEEED